MGKPLKWEVVALLHCSTPATRNTYREAVLVIRRIRAKYRNLLRR